MRCHFGPGPNPCGVWKFDLYCCSSRFSRCGALHRLKPVLQQRRSFWTSLLQLPHRERQLPPLPYCSAGSSLPTSIPRGSFPCRSASALEAVLLAAFVSAGCLRPRSEAADVNPADVKTRCRVPGEGVAHRIRTARHSSSCPGDAQRRPLGGPHPRFAVRGGRRQVGTRYSPGGRIVPRGNGDERRSLSRFGGKSVRVPLASEGDGRKPPAELRESGGADLHQKLELQQRRVPRQDSAGSEQLPPVAARASTRTSTSPLW